MKRLCLNVQVVIDPSSRLIWLGKFEIKQMKKDLWLLFLLLSKLNHQIATGRQQERNQQNDDSMPVHSFYSLRRLRWNQFRWWMTHVKRIWKNRRIFYIETNSINEITNDKQNEEIPFEKFGMDFFIIVSSSWAQQ